MHVMSAPNLSFAPAATRLIRSRPGRALTALLACVLVLGAGSATYDSVASAAAVAMYPPPGQFATLAAGHRVHYVCLGQGQPELVLFAGFGGDVLDWAPIMPGLAQSRRVCAFDRLGQGWSDHADTPDASFSVVADQMHEAIGSAGIQRPIVVGHSLGGALAQVYAARYEVAGVVLVDGLTADVADPVLARLGTYEPLAPIGRVGLLRPLAGMMVDPAYTTELRDQMFALRARSSVFGAVAREGAVAARSAGPQLRAAEDVLRARRVPLLVIGAGATDVPQLPAGAFLDAQRALVERIPSAELTVVPDAGHYVMAQRPHEVRGVIETWVADRLLDAQ
jgi:pimeloyl-ACP methyl ester carboxylesterase